MGESNARYHQTLNMEVKALIDANNFYVSCQRVFDAAIQTVPVGVMSNNDGCIIARSDELKKLVPMGTPVFKAKQAIESNNVILYSSCYPLYADMSARVMATLDEFAPIEEYSIDEAFAEFPASSALTAKGWEIKERIKKVTGIPVSVGFGATKTLAKLANRLAKKSEKAAGVLDLYQSPYLPLALERTKVADVWGIGKESAAKLARFQVGNALQFAGLDIRLVRHLLTVRGARTAMELRGVACIPLEQTPISKKAISCSRTFGEVVRTLRQLKEAIAFFLARTVEKLRKHELSAKVITVFIATDGFNPKNYYANAATAKFVYASDLLTELQARCFGCLQRIYRDGYEYKRAGVILGGLVPSQIIAGRMLDDNDRQAKMSALMCVVDEVNERFGQDTLRFAVSNPNGIWQMKQMRKSPHYTTKAADIMMID